VADLSLDKHMLSEACEKKAEAHPPLDAWAYTQGEAGFYPTWKTHGECGD
jgi:hypothetical protein